MDQEEKRTTQECLNERIRRNLEMLSELDSNWNEGPSPRFLCPGLTLRLPESVPENSEEE